MKKLLLIAIIAVLALAGCSKSKEPYSDYLGTWKAGGATSWIKIVLSADKLIFENSELHTFTLSGLSWSPCNNNGIHPTTYPVGYRIAGTLTAKFPATVSNPYKAADENTTAAVDELAVIYVFISTDKQSLGVGISGAVLSLGPFIKQ